MAKYLHNLTTENAYYLGVEVPPNHFFAIPPSREREYSEDSATLEKLVLGLAAMSRDGVTDVEGGAADQIKFLQVEELVRTKAFSDAEGVIFNGTGMAGTCPGASTTNIDKKIESQNRFDGIQIILSGHSEGDNLKVQIVDVDNVVGYGPGVVLNTFSQEWYVDWSQSGQMVVHLPYYGLIYPNLYVRIRYTATGLGSVKVYANLYLHKEV